MSNTVKVTVASGHPPLQVRGVEVKPGESFEVTEDQAAWLESHGAIEPLAKSKQKSKTKSFSTQDSEEDDPTTTEADESAS